MGQGSLEGSLEVWRCAELLSPARGRHVFVDQAESDKDGPRTILKPWFRLVPMDAAEKKFEGPDLQVRWRRVRGPLLTRGRV
jgi:hypothetical protein